MSLLMTPTLWQSIDWLQKCPDSWKKRAYTSLMDTLTRKWNPTKAIERGIAYEKAICYGENPVEKVADDLKEKFTEAYNLIHREGGSFQKVAKKIVDVDDVEFILYGKLDVHFPDLIIDIKTTGNYRGKSSYLNSWQHRVYCMCTRIPDFKFIVYEFDNNSGMLIDIHIIDYHVDDFAMLNKEVMRKLVSVRDFLRTDKKLKEAYLHKFNRYN